MSTAVVLVAVSSVLLRFATVKNVSINVREQVCTVIYLPNAMFFKFFATVKYLLIQENITCFLNALQQSKLCQCQGKIMYCT